MARLPDLLRFAHHHKLSLISIEDLKAVGRRAETHAQRTAETQLPTSFGAFTAIGDISPAGDREHFVKLAGDIGDGEDLVVRIHSECLVAMPCPRSAAVGASNFGRLTNSPNLQQELEHHGVNVLGRVPMLRRPTATSLRNLLSDRRRIGHAFDHMPSATGAFNPVPEIGCAPSIVLGEN
ncbi:hypothetical protein ACQPXM_11375 [Kribbella sp. CA-253562]|uniref:hypothetical protein n=1 Tax=Kribbella sp. CA-253562 TaxID=3239942 RepID=UPI003D8F8752